MYAAVEARSKRKVCSVLLEGLIWKMVRASLSQLALSSGVGVAICPRICRPVRKSLRLKAASASVRSVAPDLETGPASLLIWASSLIAESARSSRLKALSAACAVTRPSISVAQSVAARTKPIMMKLLADERRVSNRNAPKGDSLMATEQRGENVACDTARVSPCCAGARLRRSIALMADRRQRSAAQVGRLIGENGSERAWPGSGFFILAML